MSEFKIHLFYIFKPFFPLFILHSKIKTEILFFDTSKDIQIEKLFQFKSNSIINQKQFETFTLSYAQFM